MSAIIKNVRINGDKALIEYNARFDQNKRRDLRIGRAEIEAAYEQVSEQELADMRKAAEHIRAFAEAQKATMRELKGFETVPGVYLGHRIIPVDSCCCYVPGGSYPLYSTALMLTIPAKVAGVRRITACSPSVKGSESIDPKTLVAMDIGGADEIYAVGGAQAIAAFAYGTEQIAPVSMVVGREPVCNGGQTPVLRQDRDRFRGRTERSPCNCGKGRRRGSSDNRSRSAGTGRA